MAEQDTRPAWALGRHHAFGPATDGAKICGACGRVYTVETMWQADVDPCVDGRPTGISEQRAKIRAQQAGDQLMRELRG
jgi:hypothetical protein